MIRSACFTSRSSVSPDAELRTGINAGQVESSKSFLSYKTYQLVSFDQLKIHIVVDKDVSAICTHFSKKKAVQPRFKFNKILSMTLLKKEMDAKEYHPKTKIIIGSHISKWLHKKIK